KKFEKNVRKYNDKYHWNQNEFDALVSFAYNVGSIDQLTHDGTRDKHKIAEKMLEYDKANGKTVAGLTKRRAEEKKLFLTPAGM
ncbi:MAG: glycoside hydrolase family protein, partial [Lachnospiraceae bacterium]|nr:glycoside hydrolase family protein [Lachnospiraceae bacterium]